MPKVLQPGRQPCVQRGDRDRAARLDPYPQQVATLGRGPGVEEGDQEQFGAGHAVGDRPGSPGDHERLERLRVDLLPGAATADRTSAHDDPRRSSAGRDSGVVGTACVPGAVFPTVPVGLFLGLPASGSAVRRRSAVAFRSGSGERRRRRAGDCGVCADSAWPGPPRCGQGDAVGSAPAARWGWRRGSVDRRRTSAGTPATAGRRRRVERAQVPVVVDQLRAPSRRRGPDRGAGRLGQLAGVGAEAAARRHRRARSARAAGRHRRAEGRPRGRRAARHGRPPGYRCSCRPGSRRRGP